MWSRVLRTRDEHEVRAALDDLCKTYWPPVASYVRALGCGGDAEDVTQDFFAIFLRRDGFQRAEPERGRLRAYLKTAVRHHVLHWRRDRMAQRRGGGREAIPLDAEDAPELPAPTGADERYDEEWALVVMDRALTGLRESYAKRHRLDLYEHLKSTLLGDGKIISTDPAGALGMTRGAFAVEQHRARRRLADLLRAQVAETVDDPAEVDAELLHLLRVLARNPEPA